MRGGGGGGGGGLNVTDVRRETIPLLWSTVGEKVFVLTWGFTKYLSIC